MPVSQTRLTKLPTRRPVPRQTEISTRHRYIAMVAMALGGFGMSAHLLLTQAFRHAAPALLAPFSYCQIVFAGLLGLLIYNQVPDSASLLGIAIICLSGLGAAWMQRRK